MSSFRVTLTGQPEGYRPGDVLTGEAEWELDDPSTQVVAQLCWTTDGNVGGGGDAVSVMREPLASSGVRGRGAFRFTLPAGPWSFEGKLFSVRWFVEVGESESMYSRADFVLGPDGGVVRPAPPSPRK